MISHFAKQINGNYSGSMEIGDKGSINKYVKVESREGQEDQWNNGGTRCGPGLLVHEYDL